MVNILCTLIRLYSVIILVRAVLSWLPGMQNSKISSVLSAITEPVLEPVRKFLWNHLPQRWLRIDISPIVVWLLLDIVSVIISSLFGGII